MFKKILIMLSILPLLLAACAPAASPDLDIQNMAVEREYRRRSTCTNGSSGRRYGHGV